MSGSADTVDTSHRMDVWFADEEIGLLHQEATAAEEAGDSKQAALLFYEIGRLCLAGGNEAGGSEALLRAYTLRPQFRPPLRLAQQICRSRGQHQLLARLLEAEARASKDPALRGSLLRAQARVLWRHLADPARARAILEQLAAEGDTSWLSLLLLDMLHAGQRDHDARRAVLRRELEATTDPPLRLALQVELATSAAWSDPRAAAELMEEAHRAAPDNPLVLSLKEQLHQARGESAELVRSLVRRAELREASASTRSLLLARAARVQRDELQDAEGAIELFQRSLAQAPRFDAAVDCFALLLASGSTEEAVAAGELLFQLDELDDEPPGVAASLAFQLGELIRTGLKDAERAQTWYARCLQAEPGHRPALELVAASLERRGEVGALVQLLRAERERDPARAAEWDHQLAALLERRGQLEEAVAHYRRALAAAPDHLPSAAALERIFVDAGRWEELTQLLDGELTLTRSAPHRVDLLETMALIQAEQLGQPAEAIELLRRALELEPTRLSVIRELSSLCEAVGDWQRVVELHEQEIGLVPGGPRRVELLQRCGEIWEARLDDRERAMQCFQRALTLDPEHLPSQQALGRLFKRSGRWADLITMHEAEIEASSNPGQIVYLLDAIAEIASTKLGDEERAIACYRAILQRKPHHPPAVAALRLLLERRADWPALVELLRASLEGLEDNDSRALRLWEIGRLREEHLEDEEGAIRAYRKAMFLVPNFGPAKVALARLKDERSEPSALAHVPSALLGKPESSGEYASISFELLQTLEQGEGPHKAALLHQRSREVQAAPWLLWSLARIYQGFEMDAERREALGRLTTMIDEEQVVADLEAQIAWNAASAGDSGRGAAAAVDALAAYLERRPGSDFALRALERAQTACQDGAGRAPALIALQIERGRDRRELALLHTELATRLWETGDPGAAEAAYRQALLHDETHLSAHWGLGQLLIDQQRWAEAAELIELQASVVASPPVQADALVRSAILHEERLDDPERANALLQRAIAAQPGHAQAVARLRALHERRGDWAGLCALLRDQLQCTFDQAELVVLLTELARLGLHRLGQRGQAEVYLQRALELAPEDVPALELMAGIHLEDRSFDDAVEASERLEQLLERRLEAADSRADRAALARVRCQLGEAHLALGRPEQALAALRRIDHGAPSLTVHVQRLIIEAAEGVGDGRAKLGALEQLALCSEDPDEQLRARREAAVIADVSLGDTERAVRILQALLVLDPLDLEAVEHLATIFGRSSNRLAHTRHMQATIAHHRAAMAREPFEGRLYEQLSRIFRWERQFDPLYCAFCALAYLRELDTTGLAFLREHFSHCSERPVGQISAGAYERLLVPQGAQGPLRELMLVVGGRLARAAGASIATFGLTRGHRLTSHPLEERLRSMAAALGVTELEFDLWRAAGDPGTIAAAVFTRPALILGDEVLGGALDPAQLFQLGRALFSLREQLLFLEARPGRDGPPGQDVRLLLATLGETCGAELAVELRPEEARLVAGQVKTINRVMNRKLRRQTAELLEPLMLAQEDIDLGAYLRALRRTADRAGLVLSGDPVAAMEAAGRLYDSFYSPALGDLLQFLVSEEHFTLRRELMMAPETA